MNVVVTGIGLISSLGNLSQSWQRLLEGKTGITRQQPIVVSLSVLVAVVRVYGNGWQRRE